MMSGLMSLSGYDADTPQKTGISYGDPVAGLAAVGAIALALIKRRRTGEGRSSTSRRTRCRRRWPASRSPRSLGPAPCRRRPATGTRAGRRRAATRRAATTSGSSCRAPTTPSGRRAPAIIGRADLADLPLDERRARHDELDAAIGAWSAPLDPRVAVDVLQEAGVPAGRVLDMRTLKDDPHLYARNFWIRVPNEKMHPYRKHGVVWRMLEANPTITRHAPYLGADNRDVLTRRSPG